MLFLTAGCMQRIQDLFKKVIGMSITHSDWPSSAQLLARRVSINADYCALHESGRDIK